MPRSTGKALLQRQTGSLPREGPQGSPGSESGKLLYILHEALHFIHDGRVLDQLWVQVREVVVHVSETTGKARYIPVSVDFRARSNFLFRLPRMFTACKPPPWFFKPNKCVV